MKICNILLKDFLSLPAFFAFRRVNAEEPDAHAADFECVAVDHGSVARDVLRGHWRWQECNDGNSEGEEPEDHGAIDSGNSRCREGSKARLIAAPCLRPESAA